jgi:glycerophosphoryl diester phosphodiesterase
MKAALTPLVDWRKELCWIGERCRNRFADALALSLAFKALNLALLTPLAAAVLRLCLSRWGRASVGNFELISFFGSPVGLAALLGAGSILLASLYLEISGLLRLLADERLHWWQAFTSSTGLLHRLVQLGLRQLAVYIVLAAPFLAGIAAVYWWFWSGKDLNGLIILKPPAFWWGAGLAGAIATVYCLLAARVFLRRVYAVPILTFEPHTTVWAAVRMSVDRSQDTLWRCAAALAMWAAIQSLIAAAAMGAAQMVLQQLVGRNVASLALATLLAGAALAIHALTATLFGVLANVTFAAVVLALYRQVAPAGALYHASPGATTAPRVSFDWLLGGGLLAIAVLATGLAILAIGNLQLEDNLEITAHRAGAARAPENTVAALRLAIADRADWVEIDVQLTADKALVIMHDIDLARVGGGDRRVDQATLAEIRELDVGSVVGLQFAGERIPTLQEFLAAAGDKIRLNVELKPHGKADAPELTRRVLEVLRDERMTSRCRLCSQSYESLQMARQIEPTLEVGYIVSTAVGDPASLDVDFLMVESSLATRRLVDRASIRGIAIHAWTVNDAAQVAPLLDAGVANLITDDPARMRARLDEIRALATPQRLLLRTRHALAR